MSILLLLFLFSISSYGKMIKIEKFNKTFSLEVPNDYVYHSKFLALENVIMAPEDKNLGTASLSLTITGIRDAKFNSKELELTQKDYQEGRRRYLKERELELIEFLPFEAKKTTQGHQIHSIGFIFKSSQKITFEKSFFIECPHSLIHAKLFTHIGTNGDLEKLKKNDYASRTREDFEKSIFGFNCGS